MKRRLLAALFVAAAAAAAFAVDAASHTARTAVCQWHSECYWFGWWIYCYWTC